MRKALCTLRLLSAFVCVAVCAQLWANDSAASTAAGGVQLVREPRISMQKERLFISEKKVRVEYEFLNDTDTDVTTEVAFPIPPYGLGWDDPAGPRGFDDFMLWVEGKQLSCQAEIKATLKGKDLTPLLRKYGVDPNSFGHFNWKADKALDFEKLPAGAQAELVSAGAYEVRGGLAFALWTISKTYHWKQTFSAHQVLHMVHEYKPVVGFSAISLTALDPAYRRKMIAEAKEIKDQTQPDQLADAIAWDRGLTDSCVDAKLQARLTAELDTRSAEQKENDGDYLYLTWVDYILTTANSWKMPIRDFELVLEKPKEGGYVSFCWDGQVQKIDSFHFSARTKDFVPKRELHIAFFRGVSR